MIAYRADLLPRRQKIDPAPLKSRPQQLLDWITVCAADGERCPFNTEIAERFGYLSPERGNRLLHRLQVDGHIAIWRGTNSRVVFVIATGKHTKGPVGNPEFYAWRDVQKGRSQ